MEHALGLPYNYIVSLPLVRPQTQDPGYATVDTFMFGLFYGDNKATVHTVPSQPKRFTEEKARI